MRVLRESVTTDCGRTSRKLAPLAVGGLAITRWINKALFEKTLAVVQILGIYPLCISKFTIYPHSKGPVYSLQFAEQRRPILPRHDMRGRRKPPGPGPGAADRLSMHR